MRISVITKKRTFNLMDLTEAEGLILRTLLNLNDEGIAGRVNSDDGYWEHEVSNSEAVRIGCELRDKIFKAVDWED